MTVQELIEALQKLPPDHLVYLHAGEDGLDDLTQVKSAAVYRDVHTEPYLGPHDNADGEGLLYADASKPSGEPTPGVLLQSS